MGRMYFQTAVSNSLQSAMTICGSNVGIGTDSPPTALSVGFTWAGSGASGISFSDSYSSSKYSYLRSGSGFGDLTAYDGSTHRTVLGWCISGTGAGNVGIGNTNPTSILHIKSSQAIIQLDGTGTGATDHAGLLLQNEGSNKWHVQNHASNDRFQIYNYSQSNAGLSICLLYTSPSPRDS